ncbi:MAG: HisA/HisF-related TIM barrel protein, partial [Bacteroidota bacterium]
MMIQIIPAIDLLEGQCVRLTHGEYDSAKSYNSDPLEQAKIFEGTGFKRLHIVDLSGAKAGQPQHLRELEKIVSHTKLEIDFGGGIKTLEMARQILNAGAAMINVGSIAVREPETFKNWLSELGGDQVLLAADTRDEM